VSYPQYFNSSTGLKDPSPSHAQAWKLPSGPLRSAQFL
jgi:hypothetical protein